MKITKNNVSFDVMDGREAFWNSVNDGSWEPDTYRILDFWLKKDTVYFDIGAWVGPTYLYAAALAKEVYAFEPDMIAHQELQDNIQLSKYSNLWASHFAIGIHKGEVNLGPRTQWGDSMSSILWQKNTVSVPCITLDEIGMRLNPSFIKMDIEGGECYVLPFAKEYLRDYGPTLYLSIHQPWLGQPEMDAIADALSSYDFIYDEVGNPLTLIDVKNLKGFRAIVASNVPWK